MRSHSERGLKKISKELQQQVAKLDNVQKIESLTKRCTELYAEMKKLEKETNKQKKRADQLQKEKDQNRAELTKAVGLKEKLEKLCRELQKENNKLKVGGVEVLEHMLRSGHGEADLELLERESCARRPGRKRPGELG